MLAESKVMVVLMFCGHVYVSDVVFVVVDVLSSKGAVIDIRM